MSTDERSIAWYNEHAEEYTNHVRNPDDSIYHSLYEKPAMYSLLPDLNGKSIISLGSGSGEDCHYLALKGASTVTGIDISEELVKIAKDSYTEYDFQVMNMEHLEFSDKTFDFAYSSLALHYIEDWRGVMTEAYRVLKPGSFFLFSCNHPLASAMHVVSDSEDAKVSMLSRTRNRTTDSVTIVGDYVTRQVLVSETDLAVTTWHKSIGEIAGEVTSAGFMIANILEPKPLEKMKEISQHNYDTLVKIPAFVIFKLWKPTS